MRTTSQSVCGDTMRDSQLYEAPDPSYSVRGSQNRLLDKQPNEPIYLTDNKTEKTESITSWDTHSRVFKEE